MANNRNKRSLTIDITRDEGREVIRRLAKQSDIIASNFRPGTLERNELGYEDLRRLNPRIIFASASGYGLSGPYLDQPGQDLVAQAMGGLIALTGQEDGPPTPVGTFIADFIGAMFFAQGIMAALAAREQNGVGQIVDSSLHNGVLMSHNQENAAVLNAGVTFPRPPQGGGHSGSPPTYGVYRCADGRYIALMGGAMLSGFVDNVLGRITSALEIDPPIHPDPAWFEGARLTPLAWETLGPALARAFARFGRDAAVERLRAEGVLSGPVYELDEALSDPQTLHNEMVIEAEHPTYGKVKLTGFPVRLKDTPARLRLAPPTLGEHNVDILLELGYNREEIERMMESGVVGRPAAS